MGTPHIWPSRRHSTFDVTGHGPDIQVLWAFSLTVAACAITGGREATLPLTEQVHEAPGGLTQPRPPWVPQYGAPPKSVVPGRFRGQPDADYLIRATE